MSGFLTRIQSPQTYLLATVDVIGATFIRGCGALLTLATFTLAARAMSVDDFGRLAVWFNAINIFSVVAVLGQDTLIARSYGEYVDDDNAQAWGAYIFGWLVTIGSTAVFAVAMMAIGPTLFLDVSRQTFMAAAFFLVTQTLLQYCAHASRMIAGFVVAETSRDLIWRLVVIGVIVWTGANGRLSVEAIFAAAGVGQLISLCVALFPALQFYKRRECRAVRYDEWRLWLQRGFQMWRSAIAEAGGAYADVVLIGWISTPEEAGRFFVAARIAAVFLMMQSGLSTRIYLSSARLFFSGRVAELQRLLYGLVLLATVVPFPLLALIYAFGGELLSIFGAHYADGYWTLSILATAAFLTAAFGSASVVLLTTGHEALYSRVIWTATLVRVFLTLALTWGFGAIGAACAQAMVNAPLVVFLSALCRRRTGLDTSAFGAISNLLAPSRQRDLSHKHVSR